MIDVDIEDIILADVDEIDVSAVDAAIAAYQRLPQPIDAAFVPPIVAHREYNGLSVTDICQQVWCEHQLKLKLTLGERISDDAAATLARGTARHAELEAALGHEVVPIETASREEAFAVRFTNALSGLDELSKTGTTRELFVVGKASGVWIFGVIDQVSLCADESAAVDECAPADPTDVTLLQAEAADVEARMQRERRQMSSFAHPLHRTPNKANATVSASSVSSGYVLSDNKTRKNKSFPSIPQKRTSRFQLQLYWRLYASLCQHDAVSSPPLPPLDRDFVSTAFTTDEFLRDFCLSGDSDFSPLFIVQLHEMGLSGRNLRHIVNMYLFIFETFPRPLRSLQVHYEHQSSAAVIGVDRFTVDSFSLNVELNFYLQFWRGHRESEPCLSHEQWKCRFCEYRPECVHTTYKAKAEEIKPNAAAQTAMMTNGSTIAASDSACNILLKTLKRNHSSSSDEAPTAQRTRSIRLKRVNTINKETNEAALNTTPQAAPIVETANVTPDDGSIHDQTAQSP